MTASIISVPEEQAVVINRPVSHEAESKAELSIPDPLESDQASEPADASPVPPRTDRVKLRGTLRRG